MLGQTKGALQIRYPDFYKGRIAIYFGQTLVLGEVGAWSPRGLVMKKCCKKGMVRCSAGVAGHDCRMMRRIGADNDMSAQTSTSLAEICEFEGPTLPRAHGVEGGNMGW